MGTQARQRTMIIVNGVKRLRKLSNYSCFLNRSNKVCLNFMASEIRPSQPPASAKTPVLYGRDECGKQQKVTGERQYSKIWNYSKLLSPDHEVAIYRPISFLVPSLNRFYQQRNLQAGDPITLPLQDPF
jgi:hypothetical protein